MRIARFASPTAAAAAAACLLALPALAQNGLLPPATDAVWPALEWRITLQTAPLGPLPATALAAHGEAAAQRTVQGGALLGDYVFARKPLGSLRATGGLVLGTLSGTPTLVPAAGSRLGLNLLEGPLAAGGDTGALPYLGLGYSSPLLWRTLSVTADLGLVAGRPSGMAGVGRALFGQQAMDVALRELRLAPMLQLGVRYAF
ncbi:MAG: hypothetical protein AMXMBFR66_22460 [Pseudomonadota bacterium]|nr:hypothetical protein [Rubrivivax sp.]